MWSKFTEYAEGIVEIVAQADAAAAATVSATDSQSSPVSSPSAASAAAVAAAPASAITGEEIWSRFTSIVAPPAAAIAAPLSQKRERQPRVVEEAPRSAPPSLDQLRKAQAEAQRLSTAAATVASQQQEPLSSSSKTIDEDEQEQYICELERALLQRKKQNEVLEKQIYELEYRHEQEMQQERARFAQQLVDKEKLLAEQAQEIETLRLQQQQQQKVATAKPSDASAENQELEAKVELLEQRLRDLNARLGAVQGEYDHPRAEQGELAVSSATETPTAAASGSSFNEARVDTLMEISRLLSSSLGSIDTARSSPIADNSDLVAQILTLAKQVNAHIEKRSERVTALNHAISSFLALHGETLPTESTAEQSSSESVSPFQSKLNRITQRLSKSAADATEATRLQSKLHALEDKEEEQLKKMLHLQAQVSSMQANMQKTDKSLQQTVSKEVELLDVIEERDETIRRLEGNVSQVKASMEHLAGELKEAQSYTDELEGFCRRQKKELDVQRGRVKELEQVKSDFEALQEQEREVRARASEYEQGYVDLLAEIEKLKAENEEESKLLVANTEAHAVSAENQAIYELESRLSASEADKQVALQDAERLQNNLDALEGVLHQFQLDQKQQREHLHGLEAALKSAREQLAHSQQAAAKQVSSDSESDLQRVMGVLAKKTQECDQLREAFENAAARYTADNDVLDKRLAAQLVVTYCETEKKGEVLQLMAGMMGFSEEQKRRVGLGFPIDGNGGGGLFSSILGFVAPPDNGAATTPADLEGKSFADIWTEFLIDEAKK